VEVDGKQSTDFTREFTHKEVSVKELAL